MYIYCGRTWRSKSLKERRCVEMVPFPYLSQYPPCRQGAGFRVRYPGIWNTQRLSGTKSGPGFQVTQLELLMSSISTKGPMWGYPVFVLGAVCSFLEPFRGHLSPNIDKVS